MKLQGNLAEFPVTDVVQLISLGRKTGKMEIFNGGPTPRGILFFEDGDVVHAASGEVTGEPAVAALFPLRQGTFQFADAKEMPSRTLHVGTHQLLLRVAQRIDETRDQFVPVLDTGVEPVGPPGVAALKEEMKRIISRRLRRKARKALAALDGAHEDLGSLLDVCQRIERYASLFIAPDTGYELGKELREVIGV